LGARSLGKKNAEEEIEVGDWECDMLKKNLAKRHRKKSEGFNTRKKLWKPTGCLHSLSLSKKQKGREMSAPAPRGNVKVPDG